MLVLGAASDDVGRTITSYVGADGATSLVLGTLTGNGGGGGGIVVPGPLMAGGALSDLGVAFIGDVATSYYTGRTVAAADIDGDGVPDVALGSPYLADAVYLLFGSFDDDRPLTDADHTLLGTGSSLLGHGMDMADVTGMARPT